MKRISAILLALVLVAATAVTAFAAGINSAEQKVIDALNQPIAMSEGNMYIDASYINAMENYFNTIDMTDAEADAILAEVNSGKAFLESAGVANISDLTYAQKQTLLGYGQAAVGVLGLTMSFDTTTKQVTVFGTDGEALFTAAPTLVKTAGTSGSGSSSKVVSDSNAVKTTGAGVSYAVYIALAAVAVVVLGSSAAYLAKSKKASV